jgi:hypothetical protein
MSEAKYNKRTWLNENDSHYTGSITCAHFTDLVNRGKYMEEYMFVEFAACESKSRIHKDNNHSTQDFISKLKLIQSELQGFIDHLEKI